MDCRRENTLTFYIVTENGWTGYSGAARLL